MPTSPGFFFQRSQLVKLIYHIGVRANVLFIVTVLVKISVCVISRRCTNGLFNRQRKLLVFCNRLTEVQMSILKGAYLDFSHLTELKIIYHLNLYGNTIQIINNLK